MLRAYFQAGQKVYFSVLRDVTTDSVGYDFTFSGFLVDAPS